MAKVKKLTRRHRFRNALRQLFHRKPREDWRDLLADIDEMHKVPAEFQTLYFVCPCCGARTPIDKPKPLPDGRTIAQTIIDEVPSTDFQKKAVEFLKDVAPNLPEAEYKITAYELEKMEAVTREEHLKKHQIRRL